VIKGQPTVELDHVSAFLREGQSVDDVSLLVRHGELVALVGGDGSGKSLALMLAAGIESPQKGVVRVLGIDPALAPDEAYVDLRRRVGVVFDRPALLSNMSVFNNIAVPLRYHTPLTAPEVEDKVTEALRLWEIEHLRDWFPAQLMLSDARFVALVRALILNPEILFLDDMLLGMDARGLARLRGFFESVRAKRVMTLITSAGAPTKLFEILDRVLFFENGRIVAEGAPADVFRMQNPAVHEFDSV